MSDIFQEVEEDVRRERYEQIWKQYGNYILAAAGVVVLAYPYDSIVTLALVVGIWLIVIGVMEVISGFGMRSDAKKVQNVIGAVGDRQSA